MYKKKVIAAVLALVMCLGAGATVQAASMQGRISSCGYRSYVILDDGSLWGWGRGGLGDGAVTGHFTAPVHIMDNAVMVAVTELQTAMVVTSDGGLYTWGRNDFGQIGDGTTTDRVEPVRVLDNVIAAAGGGDFIFSRGHMLAVTSDGLLWAWGSNNRGQLGDGTTTDRHTPVPIMSDVIAAAAGAYHSFAITSDGQLWAWGSNNRGQLGDLTTADRHSPVQVMNDVAAVSGGFAHSMAVREDGSLWAWGRNNAGQLGDGTTRDRRFPVQVMEDVVAVYASDLRTAAITSDGQLWAWGNNDNGALGDGSIVNRLAPVRVMENITAISMHTHSIAVTADGGLVSWGRNYFGQVGDGTTNDRRRPVRIMEQFVLAAEAADIPAVPEFPAIPDTVTEAEVTPVGDITVLLDGAEMVFANTPLARNDFAFFPLEYSLISLLDSAGWDAETATMSGALGRNTVEVRLQEFIYIVNGVTLDSPPELAPFVRGGVIYVYIDFIAEGFGLSATWDGEARVFSITR